ncbi:hypothetical protein LSTR_LSTR008733 [Laodelphax striatellus]|uniref:Uncharacterized protein n=1 Tax=Laodelphax striatellus TaxID=195883 RepID=A0A482XR41_LAOST|nr:hypothetical protein LSTR_LSTR008733 [Laodelphax striatellus]
MKLHLALGICVVFLFFFIHLSPAEASPLSEDESRFMAEMMDEVSDGHVRSPRGWVGPAFQIGKWMGRKWKQHRRRRPHRRLVKDTGHVRSPRWMGAMWKIGNWFRNQADKRMERIRLGQGRRG